MSDPRPRGQHLYDCLGYALRIPARSQEQAVPLIPTSVEIPTYSSTIPALDARTGGIYGVTVLMAGTKSFKSALAMGIALEAAARDDRPTRVAYVIPELDEVEIDERCSLYLAAHPGARDAVYWMHFLHPGRGVSPTSLTEDLRGLIQLEDERLLVVLDSVNTLAKAGGNNYLRALDEWGLWALYARKLSLGKVAFLFISELNQRGGAKGEQIAYWADLAVKLKRKPATHQVEIDVRHARRGGEGPLGKYAFSWRQQRFVGAEAMSLRLAAANGEPTGEGWE